MKVAFVLPFAFERFFQDARDVWENSYKFENEVICKRTTFHINWCKAMQSAGMDVTLYYLSAYGNKVKLYKHDSGIKLKRVPTDFNKRLSGEEISFTLFKELYKDEPDIVFSVGYMLNSLIDMYDFLAIFCRLTGFKLIARNASGDTYSDIFNFYLSLKARYHCLYRKNGSDSNKLLKILRLLRIMINKKRSQVKFYIKKFVLSNSSLIITHTKIDYYNLLEKFGINKSKVMLLPKPVDLQAFYEIPKTEAAKKLRMDTSYKYILHVSTLYNTKGCEHIISILPDLLKLYPKIKLLVLGNGAKKKELLDLSIENGVEKNVLFLGHIEHSKLVYFYNIADVFVLPTERVVGEGQPNVILEAIACNTPPISTNIPGPSAAITEGLGLLVSMGKEDELLQAIRKVLDGEFNIDENKRKEFLVNYSFEKTGARLKNIFATLPK